MRYWWPRSSSSSSWRSSRRERRARTSQSMGSVTSASLPTHTTTYPNSFLEQFDKLRYAFQLSGTLTKGLTRSDRQKPGIGPPSA